MTHKLRILLFVVFFILCGFIAQRQIHFHVPRVEAIPGQLDIGTTSETEVTYHYNKSVYSNDILFGNGGGGLPGVITAQGHILVNLLTPTPGFYLNVNSRMKANSVSIGTLATQDNLEVAGDSNFQGNVGIGIGAPLLHQVPLTLHSNLQSDLLRLEGSDGTTNVNIGEEAGNLTVDTNLTVKGAGNSTFADRVGIGTTAPGTRLQVKSSGANTDVITVRNNAATASNIFQVSELTDNSGLIDLLDGAGNLDVRINSAGSSYFTGGNVGIGTTTPSSRLTVRDNNQGDSEPVLSVRQDNDSVWGSIIGNNTISTANSDGLRLSVDNSGKSRVETYISSIYRDLLINPNGGNVGIGTTAPRSKFHVQYSPSGLSGFTDALIWENGGGNAYINLLGGETNAQSLCFGRTGQSVCHGSVNYNSVASGAMDLRTGDNDYKMVILSNGNIGMGGSTNPDYRLTINTPGTSPLIIRNTANNNYALMAVHSISNNASLVLQNAAGTQTVDLKSSGVSYLNGGNVGVGTTAPARKFEVQSTAATYASWFRGVNGGNITDVHIANPTTGVGIDIDTWSSLTNAALNISNNNYNIAWFGNNGNVGINTTAPAYKLHVNGTVNSSAYRLANGFVLGQGGSSYGSFNSWVDIPGYHGIYSSVYNGAHFYVNNGSYGAWRISGNRNGWHGLEFDAEGGNLSFMMGHTGQGWGSQQTGIHNNTYGWLWRFDHNKLMTDGGAYFGGNVGIGIAAPTNKLHTYGGGITAENTISVGIGTVVSGLNGMSIASYNNADAAALGYGNRIRYGGAGTNAGAFAIAGVGDSIKMYFGGSNGNQVSVGGSTAFPSVQTKMRITSSDNSSAYEDWPAGWGGGLASWDMVVASIKYSGLTQRSDIRLKERITGISNGIDPLKTITQLNGVNFYWKDGRIPGMQYGYIAQEVEPLLPSLVQNDEKGFKSLNYIAFIPVITEAIKQQQEEFETQNVRLNTLESDLNVSPRNILSIRQDQGGSYHVYTNNTVISRIASLAKLIAAKIESGFIETKQLIVNGLDVYSEIIETKNQLKDQELRIAELEKEIEKLHKER